MNQKTGKILVKVALAVLLLAAGAALYLSPLRAWFTVPHLKAAIASFQSMWYAPILFILAYAVGCVFAIPASIFILVAGLVWGWKLGGIYALVGGLGGAMLSFYVARFLGGNILHRFGSRGEKLAHHLHHAGFKSLLILRLIPLFPFAVLNYGAGVAGIRPRHFLGATAIGLAPGTFVFAYSAELLMIGQKGEVFRRLAIVLALMLVVVGVPMLFKRKAEETLHLDENES